MAEWIFEDGIGEARAALVEHGAILEARIDLPGGLRAGSIAVGRLAKILVPGRAGLADLGTSGEALLQPLPVGLSEGASLTVEHIREAIGHKRPVCRAAQPGGTARDGPDLEARIAASGIPVRCLDAHEEDALEAAGWSELIEAATSGDIGFTGGRLLMSLTPAMTLFDVDGTLPAAELALAGATAAGRAVRAMDVAGSIGIDLPTLGERGVRQAAAAALDTVLPPPFERTAVNGFGFLQIVRPQARASLPQLLIADRAGAAARALLRRAERVTGRGPRTVTAHPRVIARVESETGWLGELQRRIGAPVALRGDPALAISGGHVEAAQP